MGAGIPRSLARAMSWRGVLLHGIIIVIIIIAVVIVVVAAFLEVHEWLYS